MSNWVFWYSPRRLERKNMWCFVFWNLPSQCKKSSWSSEVERGLKPNDGFQKRRHFSSKQTNEKNVLKIVSFWKDYSKFQDPPPLLLSSKRISFPPKSLIHFCFLPVGALIFIHSSEVDDCPWLIEADFLTESKSIRPFSLFIFFIFTFSSLGFVQCLIFSHLSGYGQIGALYTSQLYLQRAFLRLKVICESSPGTFLQRHLWGRRDQGLAEGGSWLELWNIPLLLL